jgi:hypothetical protein
MTSYKKVKEKMSLNEIVDKIYTEVSDLSDESFEQGQGLIIDELKNYIEYKSCFICKSSILVYYNDDVYLDNCNSLQGYGITKEQFEFELKNSMYPEEELPKKFNCFKLSLNKLIEHLEFKKKYGNL